MLSIHALTVEYQIPEGDPLPALGPVSLEIPPGEFVCQNATDRCGRIQAIRHLG